MALKARVGIMTKIVAAASGAWFLGGTVILLPGMTPVLPIPAVVPITPATSTGDVPANAPAKTDRPDSRGYGPACSERGWPYYEPNCNHNPNGEAKPMRIVLTDRGPYGVEFASPR
jgi:hypothetical protein